jgi:hypothetical protein
MVDSSPSDGASSRDPEAPVADDGCTSDPDVDSADDDQWVRAIEALARRADPVPAEVLRAARAALRVHDPEQPSTDADES